MLKSTQRFSLALAASALVFAGVLTTTAQAEVASREVPQVVVRYNDISLTTERGVQVLYKRLQAAARQVCRAYEGRDLLSSRAKWQACYDQALAGAVNNVNVEQLTALYKKNVSKISLS
jgi:UrcA family protein